MQSNLNEKLNISHKIIESIYNSDDFRHLVDWLNGFHDLPTIIFSGVGKNWYICEKEVKTYISMGIHSASLDCTHALHGDLGMLMDPNEQKVLIFVSKSGTTTEMISLLNIIKDLISKNIIKNIVLVGLSMNPMYHSYEKYNQLFDFVLAPNPKDFNDDSWRTEFDSRNLIPSLSINSTQLVLDLLGIEIYENRPLLVDQYRYNHLGGNNGRILGMSNYVDKMTNL